MASFTANASVNSLSANHDEPDNKQVVEVCEKSKKIAEDELAGSLPIVDVREVLEKSALQGNQSAALKLAEMYRCGFQVEKSQAHAFAWVIWAKLHCDTDVNLSASVIQSYNLLNDTVSTTARKKEEKILAELIARGNYRMPAVTHPLAKAIDIASTAHLNHPGDKGGAPYILHPLRIMARMTTDEERMTAVLHDVVEDHCGQGFTFEFLAKQGIPQTVIAALRCVTKTEEEARNGDAAYSQFIRRSAANPIARAVKLADLEDNLNMLRLGELTDKDITRMKKYHANWSWLKSQV